MHPLRVSLEDLYMGKTAKVVVPRAIYERDPAGPIADRAGNRYTKKVERELLEVTVERGMKDRQRITFAGKGDQLPGQLPGDIVLVVDAQAHDTFQRRGSDLIMKKEITLLEALTGTRFVVEHLDGHKMLVSTKAGEVLETGSVRQVVDEGMPVYGHPHVFGVLFVQFEVKFPEKLELTDAMKRVLSGILPGPAAPPALEDGMKEKLVEEVRRRHRHRRRPSRSLSHRRHRMPPLRVTGPAPAAPLLCLICTRISSNAASSADDHSPPFSCFFPLFSFLCRPAGRHGVAQDA